MKLNDIGDWKKKVLSLTIMFLFVGTFFTLFSHNTGAVQVTADGLNTGYFRGNQIDFNVSVYIELGERIPLNTIQVVIAGSTAINAIFYPNGSPLAVPIGMNVTLISLYTPFYYGYGYGDDAYYYNYGNRYGYDYDDEYLYDFGYGYGYVGRLTYHITINSSILNVGNHIMQLHAGTGTPIHTYYSSIIYSFNVVPDPPIANADIDQVVNMGDTVTFDGSGSSDNTGALNYTWTFNDNVTVNIYGISPTYQFNNYGVFVVTLTVMDTTGYVDTDTMSVTVNDVIAPVANAGPDQTAIQNEIVRFNGSASVDNVGIENYAWTFTYNSTILTFYGVSPQYAFWTPGIYMITLTVQDAAGNNDADTMNVTVNDIAKPIADAGPDQVVDMGDIVTFNGIGSWDNVDIANFTWTFNDGVVNVTLYTISPTYQFNNRGIFVVILNVTDAEGSCDTDTMQIIVHDATPPVANAGPDQAVDEGSLVTFNGSASSDNVGITNCTWHFTFNGSVISLYGYNPIFFFSIPGNYTVTLTVRDASVNTDTDTMIITVNSVIAPITDSDGDGVADNTDTDDDGDGYLDEWETYLGTDSKDSYDEPVDTDYDGIPDGDLSNSQAWMDTDDDEDGVLDSEDPEPLNPNVTGISNERNYWMPLIIVIIILVLIVIILLFKTMKGKKSATKQEDATEAEPESTNTEPSK